jgi:hypothetical protein
VPTASAIPGGGPRRTAIRSLPNAPNPRRRNHYGGAVGALTLRLEEERRQLIAAAPVEYVTDESGRTWTVRRL